MSIESTINTIDDVPPIITVTGVNDGDVLRTDAKIDVVLSELGGWYAEVTSGGAIAVHDGPFVLEATDTSTTYEMTVFAEDLSGNTAQQQLTFTLDSRVPVIEISGVTSGEHTKEDVHLLIEAISDDVNLLLTKDGTPVGVSMDTLLTEEGKYELIVEVVSGSYEAERRVAFVIDKTPPTIAIEGVEEGGSYQQHAKPEVLVTDLYSTQLSDLTALLNGMEYLVGTKISIAGDYELTVEATDLAGNTATETVHFAVTGNEKTR